MVRVLNRRDVFRQALPQTFNGLRVAVNRQQSARWPQQLSDQSAMPARSSRTIDPSLTGLRLAELEDLVWHYRNVHRLTLSWIQAF